MADADRTITVFVDRDGVINENRDDYVKAWQEFVFIPGSIEALASMSRIGIRIFVATNQSVVGRGQLAKRDLDVIHTKMTDVLTGSGAKIESVLACVHHPDDNCICRKPEPGLIMDAAKRFEVDLRYAFVIGDAASDIEAGGRAGCRTVLVKTGRGAEAARADRWNKHKPDFVADDLVDAALWIMTQKALLSSGINTGVLKR